MNIYHAQMLIDADQSNQKEFNPFRTLILYASLPDAAKNNLLNESGYTIPNPETLKAYNHMSKVNNPLFYNRLSELLKKLPPVVSENKRIQYKLYKFLVVHGYKPIKENPFKIRLNQDTFIHYEIDKKYHLYINGSEYKAY